MAGSAPQNSQAVDFEKQQAQEAAAKEQLRQQRLTQGQSAINAIYDGSPVMGTRNAAFNWGNWGDQTKQFAAYAGAGGKIDGTQVPGMPDGYTYKTLPGGGTTVAGPGGAAATRGPNVSSNPNTPNYNLTGGAPAAAATSAPGGGYGIVGPDGKTYAPGSALNYTDTYDTGQKSGGFGDDFYAGYTKKLLDYYQPQESQQYNQAQSDLRYNLARSGNLQSSVAADKQGGLVSADALARGQIVNNANQQTGQLRDSIASQKASLINQLYATEDPTLAANLAQSSARASQLQDPMMTPAASLFTPALTAVGSALSNYTYPGQQYNSPYGQPQGAVPPPATGTNSSKLSR